jgi:hypothetical protein
MSRNIAQQTPVPTDHGGYELGHHHLGIAAQGAKGGGEGEPHTQTSDEDAGPVPIGESITGQLCQGIFRAVDGAKHELAAIQLDHQLVAPAHEPQCAATIGYGGGVDELPGLHDRCTTAKTPTHASLPAGELFEVIKAYELAETFRSTQGPDFAPALEVLLVDLQFFGALGLGDGEQLGEVL